MKKTYTKLYIFLGLFAIGAVITIYYLQSGPKDQPIIVNDLSTNAEQEAEEEIVREVFGINANDFEVTENKVKSGESLGLILGRENVDNLKVHNLIKLSDTVFNVRNINVNNTYLLFHDKDSAHSLHYMVYLKSKLEYVVFDVSDSLRVFKNQRKLTKTYRYATGTISSSLSQTMLDQNLSILLSHRMEDIYAWTINFFALQKGDSFEIVYEKLTIDDTIDAGVGNIVNATFTHKDQSFNAYSFQSPEGWTEFYNEDGRSLRKSFLMAPLKTYRISSKYQKRRFHPVQKRWKAHKGTDFAAPRGTPIMSTANGTVIKAGYTSGNGNYVKVKHNSKYTTQYLHMTRFAKGIKAGTFVKQGEVIGYVGSTGLATGPHVCYRFWVNGKQVDPYKQKLPDAEPIKKEYLDQFKERMTELSSLKDSLIAATNE
ncbi:MAG: peptidoglycan DD-metalloendopeptidase family protein [Schleiferiaceae bacterium]|jgi:murein DD-endopeptidase MepM/ murein hydrolase activator NlpD|nr:peptidoglycan DD-metalloendopeptidase family protein [Schleiferiaceae bacterium]